jgi:zinc protease
MTESNNSLPGLATITRTVLDNGITVLVYENFAAQSVFLVGTMNVGGLYVAPEQNGLSALTTSALMRGTHNRDFTAIHATLEDVGADFNVHSGMHKTGFSGKALAEDLPILVDVLADILRQPAFPEQQVERLKGEVLTWLHYRQQDTRWQAGRLFRQNLYPSEHPYHHGSQGTLETIPTLTTADMQAFHRQHFGPTGMVISVVGAVDTQAAIAIVEEGLGDWENPDQPPIPALPDVPPVSEIRRSEVQLPGKTQADLIFGVVGPSRFAEDYTATSLANSVLGQFGMMGRIGQVVREDLGLAYYAVSQLEGGYGPGAWRVAAGVNPANVELAIERSLGEIQRLITETVSDDDLADNQSYYTGRLPLQLESNEGLATSILSMENYQLGLDYLVDYHDKIYALTKEDLLAAAQRYWNPEAFVVSVAGPDG